MSSQGGAQSTVGRKGKCERFSWRGGVKSRKKRKKNILRTVASNLRRK
jgi:hypothetical protein